MINFTKNMQSKWVWVLLVTISITQAQEGTLATGASIVRGSPADLPRMRRLHEAAIASGRLNPADQAIAQVELAFMLGTGIGGSADLPQARWLYEVAVGSGSLNSDDQAHAQLELAVLLSDPTSGPVDLPRARRLYKAAIASGKLNAQTPEMEEVLRDIDAHINKNLYEVKDFIKRNLKRLKENNLIIK